MLSQDDQPKPDRPATRVLLLLMAQRRDEAARLLVDSYGATLRGIFMNNSLRDCADEMLSDTFCKFISMKKPPDDLACAEAYLFQMARNVVLDHARRRNSISRGGGTQGGPAEILMDDEELLEAMAASNEPSEDPQWHKALKDCVEKALAFMRKELPAAAEALWLQYRDYSAQEVAIYYGAVPNELTPRLLANARQRISDACKKARPYFQHCKD